MSKKQDKRERVDKRWKALKSDINELFNTIEFESFSEWKDTIEEEIIIRIKRYNVLAWYGREWKVNTIVDPIFNTYTFDVRTVKGNWRVLKIQN